MMRNSECRPGMLLKRKTSSFADGSKSDLIIVRYVCALKGGTIYGFQSPIEAFCGEVVEAPGWSKRNIGTKITWCSDAFEFYDEPAPPLPETPWSKDRVVHDDGDDE